ncbi:hypothetical protein LIER_24963 [Lithospermum erythrorhizon]|uniref:Uncharacterized protein n=1 Tax=Lithospermum erythrorhizon TaxID=34254 RepID=A0AAV3R4G8_LITER
MFHNTMRSHQPKNLITEIYEDNDVFVSAYEVFKEVDNKIYKSPFAKRSSDISKMHYFDLCVNKRDEKVGFDELQNDVTIREIVLEFNMY